MQQPGAMQVPPSRNVDATLTAARSDPGDLVNGRVVGTPAGATWLGRRLLLLVIHLDGNEEGHPEVEVRGADGTSLPTRRHAFPVEDEAAGRASGLLVVALTPGSDGEGQAKLSVVLRSGRRGITVAGSELELLTVDLRTFLRDHLAGLEEGTRGGVMAFLSSTSDLHAEEGGLRELGEDLTLVREALREHYPLSVSEKDAPRAFHVDLLGRVDGRGFWVKGWARDVDGGVEGLTAVSPEGHRVELLPQASRHRRADVERFYGGVPRELTEQFGFLAFFDLPSQSSLLDGWLFQMRSRSGARVEIEGPAPIEDLQDVRNGILSEVARGQDDPESFVRLHAHPALSRIQKRMVTSASVTRIVDFGPPRVAPDVSVIVPLFRNVELVEHQLVSLADDADFRDAELVYVLASPGDPSSVEASFADLQALYGLPLRLTITSERAGFPEACNVGASVARGGLLLFLHTDVFPAVPGWLGALRRCHAAMPSPGAVGPKLLYEDDSIQSAGLFLRDAPGWPSWEASSYFHALHRSFPGASVSRPVAALSDACLLVGRELFDELGGFATDFVAGGYQDCDFSLRLAKLGRSAWYAPEAELYHLPGQCYPANLNSLTQTYNRWLLGYLNRGTIAAHAERFPVSGMVPAPEVPATRETVR